MNVLGADDGICVINSNRPNVGQCLNFGSSKAYCQSEQSHSREYIHVLDLIVGHRQSKLLNSGLDCVPAGQAGSKVYVADHSKQFRLEDFKKQVSKPAPSE